MGCPLMLQSSDMFHISRQYQDPEWAAHARVRVPCSIIAVHRHRVWTRMLVKNVPHRIPATGPNRAKLLCPTWVNYRGFICYICHDPVEEGGGERRKDKNNISKKLFLERQRPARREKMVTERMNRCPLHGARSNLKQFICTLIKAAEKHRGL